jgi:2-hydroxychromene-2-carboxylate isomerase
VGGAGLQAAAFYFDLASPHAYLAAERILHELPLPAPWQPLLASELPGGGAREGAGGAWTQGERAQLERLARECGLQPVRWPEPFPFDSALAMRVASYAQQIGRGVAFAQAAFRQAYAGGRSLEDPDNVLIAAAACEMHPAAVLRAANMRSVAAQLEATTAQAASEGVERVPAIVLAGTGTGLAPRVLQGERALDDALAALKATAGAGAA